MINILLLRNVISISMRVYLTNLLIKSSLFALFSLCCSIYKLTFLLLLLLILLIFPFSLLSMFLSLKTLHYHNYYHYYALLPLLLVFMFLLVFTLLYLFGIVSFSQCCYSYQINIAIIVSFVNFLIYTFAFNF